MNEIVNISSYVSLLKSLNSGNRKTKLSDLVPIYILRYIYNSKLLEIDDVNTRSKVFIKYLYAQRNMKFTTAVRYYRLLKPYIFRNSQIRLNPIIFDRDRQSHQKIPNFEHMDNMIKYVKHKWNTFIVPIEKGHDVKRVINDFEQSIPLEQKPFNYSFIVFIIFIMYTNLRVSEALRFTIRHLQDLLQFKTSIVMRIKNSNNWEVVYYPEFVSFIKQLGIIYHQQLQFSAQFNVYEPIFPTLSPPVVDYKFKQLFLYINKEKPVLGFGVHWFRSYVATNLRNINELQLAQKLLGHKHQKTTERYVRLNVASLQKALQNINKTSLYSKIINDDESN